MTSAAVIYDPVTGNPLMVVTDATDAQLADPAYNPEGASRIVIPMEEYQILGWDGLLALIPKAP